MTAAVIGKHAAVIGKHATVIGKHAEVMFNYIDTAVIRNYINRAKLFIIALES